MLKIVIILTIMLACALATSDPNAMFCSDKCVEWDRLEQACIDEHNCYPNGQWDENSSMGCIEQCWDIPAPCRIECSQTFDDCSNQCSGLDDPYTCFETCFSDNFNPPAVPTK